MPRPILSPPLAAAVIAILLAFTATARAQKADVAQAKKAYRLGYQALQRGDYAAALKHYQHSYELVPRPRTLFNIAVSEEKLGRVKDALRHYARFLEIAEDRDKAFEVQARQKIVALAKKLPKDVEPATKRAPPPAPVHDIAPPPAPVHHSAPPPAATSPARRARVCPDDRFGTLRVHSSLGGATVSVDGMVVGATSPGAASGKGGAALDHTLAPGDHDVIVERPGARSWHRRLHVSGGETVTVDVAFRDEHPTRTRVLTWGLVGAGTVSIATGGTLGVLALRDVTSSSPGDHSRGKMRAAVTDVLLVGGAAALYGAWRLGHHPDTTATVHRTSPQTVVKR